MLRSPRKYIVSGFVQSEHNDVWSAAGKAKCKCNPSAFRINHHADGRIAHTVLGTTADVFFQS